MSDYNTSEQQNKQKTIFPVSHLEALLRTLQEKKVRAKDFYRKHGEYFTFKLMTKDQILGIAEKGEAFLQNAIDFAHQGHLSEIKLKDSSGVPIDFDELCAEVYKTLDEFLSLPIASIIEAEGNRLNKEVKEEMRSVQGRMGVPITQFQRLPTNLQEMKASIQQATNSLRELTQEASAVLDVGRKLNRLRELDKLRIIELVKRDEETCRINEERLLQTLEDETFACRAPCAPCPKKESCIVQKMLPVFHFISIQDEVMVMYLPRITGKQVDDNDERLGASYEELLAEVGGDREDLRDILGRLMEHSMIRQLANGRYTQVGI